jgi:D-alanyl-D-alanine carboxypeptidase
MTQYAAEAEDVSHWAHQVETPFLGVHEWLDESPAATGTWAGTPDQVAFREDVLLEAIARKARQRPAQRDLQASEMRPVPGTRIAMRADAAEAAGRMIAAANGDLAAAARSGEADAARTLRITGVSGYRSNSDQYRVWRAHFEAYYADTSSARARLPGGPHSRAAVAYMLDEFHIPRRVAAPGWSNHQNGIAIDLKQVRTRGHAIANSTREEAKARWRATWFYRWLQQRARSFGFTPYAREPWHWEYTVAADPSAGRRAMASGEVDQLVYALTEGQSPLGWEAPGEDESDARAESFDEHEYEDEDEDAASSEWEVEAGEWEDVASSEWEADRESDLVGEFEEFTPDRAWAGDRESEELEDEGAIVSGHGRWSSDAPSALEGEEGFDDRDLNRNLDEDASLGVTSEVSLRRPRWTRCFATGELQQFRQAYSDNVRAAAAASSDRAACIVMLNVGLGHLLRIRQKQWPARRGSSRRVLMGDLTTSTVDNAMQQLTRQGHAQGPTVIEFRNARGRRAGSTAPVSPSTSPLATVLARSPRHGCNYVFGMSIMDGYHSVLLVVDKTGSTAVVRWYDQFSPADGVDVTTTIDQRITNATRTWWQHVWDQKHVGYNTTLRIWQLRKLVAAPGHAARSRVTQGAR